MQREMRKTLDDLQMHTPTHKNFRFTELLTFQNTVLCIYESMCIDVFVKCSLSVF